MDATKQYGSNIRCIVTGGAGFIGSHLVDRLIEMGCKVAIIDDLSTGNHNNINTEAEFHDYDISEHKGRIIHLFHDFRPHYVFHLAAMARIPECVEKPVRSFQVNALATVWLLQQAREWGAKFIFSSSSSVYGDVEPSGIKISEGYPVRPISLYGSHKLTAEQQTLLYAKYYDIQTVALRYFNVYGTHRQNPEGAYPNVFSAFAKNGKEKGEITIYGDGNQQRDFIHVYDVVRANAMWIGKETGWGEAYNVGTGQAHSVNQVADYFNRYKKNYQPARVGDPFWSCADVSKIKAEGFTPEISFDQGVRLYLKDIGYEG